MSKIDLHIHSEYSNDGEFSISCILEMCKSTGMKLVSITDHNSVRGTEEALTENAGGDTGLQIISGIELDCTYKEKNLHLLGYSIDHTRSEFFEIEKDIISQEREAAEEKITLFQKATGIPVNINEIIDSAKNDVITGEAIAGHVLIKDDAEQYEILKPYLPGGAKSDMPNAWFYWDFFSPGKPAHVPIRNISLPEARDLIRNANGLSVLAHPGQSLSGNYSLLEEIISEGIDGIEVFCSYHSSEDAAFFLEAAKQNRLLITFGSDFHGKNKPQIRIGDHGSVLDDEILIKEMRLFQNFSF